MHTPAHAHPNLNIQPQLKTYFVSSATCAFRLSVSGSPPPAQSFRCKKTQRTIPGTNTTSKSTTPMTTNVVFSFPVVSAKSFAPSTLSSLGISTALNTTASGFVPVATSDTQVGRQCQVGHDFNIYNMRKQRMVYRQDDEARKTTQLQRWSTHQYR